MDNWYRRFIVVVLSCLVMAAAQAASDQSLRVHNIFSSHMVIQRNKPIMIWGWAEPGDSVTVRFGEARAEADADSKTGRWEVTFPARKATSEGQTLTVSSGDETVEMEDILIGDVWVMNGQSNMAHRLGRTYRADLETATANLPQLRRVGIKPNESYKLQKDLPDNKVEGWTVCSPKTAGGFSSIGYTFASRLQRALQIPIGIIDNARGGASIESLVPRHKFDDHPRAEKYLEWVEQRRDEFDWEKAMKPLIKKWKKKVAKKREEGVPEEKLPPRPTRKDLRSWNVPGRSPSDASSCYNGMFGVFKGLNIKGVLFHQGYNNAMMSNCWPKRYRVLMKLMVEGWREDFNDEHLPVGVIGLCAGSIAQTHENFEIWSLSSGSYIRESQRLGLADVNDPEHTGFIPAYDQRIPGLHPKKKHFLGRRSARWALSDIYGMRINWETVNLVSSERKGSKMVLTFDKDVLPDNMSMVIKGFSIAGEDKKFYKAYARQPLKKDVGIWNTANKSCDNKKVIVWSPLVEKPVAVRYAWARSPMGNLKVAGKPWLPVPSFRTDEWDWPESDDPSENAVNRAWVRKKRDEAAERCKHRKMEEAKRAVKIREKLEALGSP